MFISSPSSPIVDGLNDFTVKTEQYYMHVDPAVNVMAYTVFPIGSGPFIPDEEIELEKASGFGTWNFEKRAATHGPHVVNGLVEMPVVWSKFFGREEFFIVQLDITQVFSKKNPYILLCNVGFNGQLRGNATKNQTIKRGDFGG